MSHAPWYVGRGHNKIVYEVAADYLNSPVPEISGAFSQVIRSNKFHSEGNSKWLNKPLSHHAMWCLHRSHRQRDTPWTQPKRQAYQAYFNTVTSFNEQEGRWGLASTYSAKQTLAHALDGKPHPWSYGEQELGAAHWSFFLRQPYAWSRFCHWNTWFL